MIRTYLSNRRKYEIVPSDYTGFPGANTFTVIVGKNGTGKSRLLQGVVTEVLKGQMDSTLFDREERLGRWHSRRASVDFNERPPKIVCVSTSPFDKFPLLRRNEQSQLYSYLGLRGLPSNNLSTAYMSRIIAALIRSVAAGSEKSRPITDVLHYLGYEGVIHCTFSIGLPASIQGDLLLSEDPLSTISNLRTTVISGYDGTNLIRQLRESEPADVTRALNLIKYLKSVNRKPRLDLYLDSNGIHTRDMSMDVEDILILLRTGVARLRDVSLRKADFEIEPETFRLSEASSGEQSVVMGLLGIASQIEDNCLICIDEPEVCLHPEWQERYVHLLLETFSNRQGCQFIIATHSPQVVAELPQANCFVMNMADGKAIPARELSHRSIDFQLASVFKTPGRHNEFLNRIALNLFARMSEKKQVLSEDRQTISFLVELAPRLKENDPLKDLISALDSMRDTYGRDN